MWLCRCSGDCRSQGDVRWNPRPRGFAFFRLWDHDSRGPAEGHHKSHFHFSGYFSLPPQNQLAPPCPRAPFLHHLICVAPASLPHPCAGPLSQRAPFAEPEGPDAPPPQGPTSLLVGGEPSSRGRCTPPTPGIRSDPDLSFYRSFEPILRLLPQGISPVSQHWATWALYNLVSVYREYPLDLCSDTGLLTGLQAHLPPASL